MAKRVDAFGVEVGREASTDTLYRKRLVTLTRRANRLLGRPASLFETVDGFCAAHGEFKDSTIRQYASALRLAIEEAESDGRIGRGEADECRVRLTQLPQERPKDAEKRTSAKKAKSVKPEAFYLVCDKLRRRGRKDDLLLVRLLVHNITFGLRPVEYLGAEVQELYLVVQSAKATNGRGLDATREFSLEDLGDGQVESLNTLVRDIELAANGNVEALIDRLGARLRRACISLNVPVFSLYTTRHQAIANKKSTGSEEEVIAFAGHITGHTSRNHYAPKGRAWKNSKTAKPSLRMIQLVEERKAARRMRGPRP